MRVERTKKGRIENFKTVGIILLSLAVMIISQLISMAVRELFVRINAPIDGNVIMSVLYVALTLLGLKMICGIRKVKLSDYRITKPSVKPVWAVSAIAMPLLVVIMTMFVGGEWTVSKTNGNQLAECLTMAVMYFGIAVGTVEESVFRGVIMSEIESCSSKYIAVIVPSVLFGLLHIGTGYGFISCLQVVAAGSVVGILFSIVTYQSGSIWSGALMHAVWNVFMCSGLLHIGTIQNDSYTVDYAVFNYILHTDSFVLTGGEFGIEASIFSIVSYMLFIVLAFIMEYKFCSVKTKEPMSK